MGAALFRALLLLLPRGFRREFGEEMCRTVREQRADLGGEPPLRFWLRQGASVVREAVRLRLGRGGGVPGAWAGGVPARPDRKGTGTMMDGLRQDLRQAGRSLGARPGFTFVTVLTLALGIGATTAIFSAVHAVLLRSLPYEEPERVVTLWQADAATGERSDGISAANIRDLGERSERLSAVAVAEPWSLDLSVEGRAEALRGWAVSEGFFEAIGVRPLVGRTFLPEEFREGAPSTVVLGYGVWRSRFGSDPGIVGRTLQLDRRAHTVVGVLPEEFRFPDASDLWTPRPPQERDAQARGADYMTGVARLAPGASPEAAAAEVERIAASLAELHPGTNRGTTVRLVPLREHLFGDVRTPLLVLFGAVALVLLIACANVTGLLLARGQQRGQEYALRGALGAPASRLVRLVAVETGLLAGLGCLLGVGLAFAGVRVIQGLGPDHLPRIDQLRIDGTVLLFAVLTAGLSALMAGLAPAARLSRPDLRSTLVEGSRGTTGSRRGNRLRGRIVVAEVALALMLLIGAGLLFRSFSTLLDNELGFDPEGRLAVQIFAYDYDSGEARAAFVRQSIEAIRALPGVRDVALTSNVPLATDGEVASIEIDVPFTVEDRAPPPEGQEPITGVTMISAGYPEVLGIPVVSGRGFSVADDATAPPVIAINETLARRHFPDGDPVGEKLVVRFGGTVPREIVGVLRDVRPSGFESPPRPEVYLPLTQVGSGSLTFLVHSEVDPAGLTGPAMEAIWSVNPAQAIWGAATLPSLLSEWTKERRFNLVLLSAFALLAVLLAAIGIYGLVSFSVEQRVAELGLRRALGGERADLLWMVLREGAVLGVLGVGIGVAGALGLTRFLRGMLFGIEPTDPVTFTGLALLVLLVAVASAWVPARRATRVDPMVALRKG